MMPRESTCPIEQRRCTIDWGADQGVVHSLVYGLGVVVDQGADQGAVHSLVYGMGADVGRGEDAVRVQGSAHALSTRTLHPRLTSCRHLSTLAT